MESMRHRMKETRRESIHSVWGLIERAVHQLENVLDLNIRSKRDFNIKTIYYLFLA